MLKITHLLAQLASRSHIFAIPCDFIRKERKARFVQ